MSMALIPFTAHAFFRKKAEPAEPPHWATVKPLAKWPSQRLRFEPLAELHECLHSISVSCILLGQIQHPKIDVAPASALCHAAEKNGSRIQRSSDRAAAKLSELYGDQYEGVFSVDRLKDSEERMRELASEYRSFEDDLVRLRNSLRMAGFRKEHMPKSLIAAEELVGGTIPQVRAFGQRWIEIANALPNYRYSISRSQAAHRWAPTLKLKKAKHEDTRALVQTLEEHVFAKLFAPIKRGA